MATAYKVDLMGYASDTGQEFQNTLYFTKDATIEVSGDFSEMSDVAAHAATVCAPNLAQALMATASYRSVKVTMVDESNVNVGSAFVEQAITPPAEGLVNGFSDGDAMVAVIAFQMSPVASNVRSMRRSNLRLGPITSDDVSNNQTIAGATLVQLGLVIDGIVNDSISAHGLVPARVGQPSGPNRTGPGAMSFIEGAVVRPHAGFLRSRMKRPKG